MILSCRTSRCDSCLAGVWAWGAAPGCSCRLGFGVGFGLVVGVAEGLEVGGVVVDFEVVGGDVVDFEVGGVGAALAACGVDALVVVAVEDGVFGFLGEFVSALVCPHGVWSLVVSGWGQSSLPKTCHHLGAGGAMAAHWGCLCLSQASPSVTGFPAHGFGAGPAMVVPCQ